MCGTSWNQASTTCAKRCFLGDEACPAGESCFGNVIECKDKLPPLTAEDVGQGEKTYTPEEIAALAEEEAIKEAEEAAMSDTQNWWCGTSWTNMLENCSKRCMTDDDCTVNSWEKATCFKTTGGPENCSTPGVGVKEAVAPGSRWCGSSWNDMLETCESKCEADEDCPAGKQCWEAPGTCEWIGVPVKQVSDPSTLWCGTTFDDAKSACHKACPTESDDECPTGMSCFAGSDCKEEGVPIVRDNYRCGLTWDDASEKCGDQCQKDEDCNGDICFADVVCAKDLAMSESGMKCGSSWESAGMECGETCTIDSDCPEGKWCYWVECEGSSSSSNTSDESTSSTNTEPTLAGCSAEVKQCSDGQFVGRAPELNCEFYPCPEDDVAAGDGGGEAAVGSGVDAVTTVGGESVGSGVGEASSGGVTSGSSSSNIAAEGWGSIPLTFASEACSGECTLCQGDCNSDADCAGGLMCFSRGTGEVTSVPGCVSGGEGDLPGMDYCYTPFPPETTTATTSTTTTTTSTTRVTAPDLNFVRECTAEDPCNACEGDCDDHTHCAGSLECFSRDQGSVDLVPGCNGLGVAGEYCVDTVLYVESEFIFGAHLILCSFIFTGMDYCYDPYASIIVPSTNDNPPTASPMKQLTGCSAEVRACQGGGIVFQNPQNNCDFDPCPNEVAAKPNTPKTTPSPIEEVDYDPATYYCGYDINQVNDNCVAAEPCPSGSDTECSGLEVCFRGTNCADAPTTTELPTTTTEATTTTTTTQFVPPTCDTLCLDVLPSGFCPIDFNLPGCLEISIGEVCEGSGECATDDKLNNCQTYDVYVRVECGGNTPSQGFLMANNITVEAEPTTTTSTLPVTTTTSAQITLAPTSAPTNATFFDNSTIAIASNVTSIIGATTIAPSPSVSSFDTTGGVSFDITTNTATTIASTAGGSFTYDRSPETSDTQPPLAAEESTGSPWEKPSNAETSPTTSDPYADNEGWDFDSYFTSDLRSSSRSSILSKSATASIIVFGCWLLFDANLR